MFIDIWGNDPIWLILYFSNGLQLNPPTGCFFKWWYPHFTPQVLIIFSRKTPWKLLGKSTILGNPHIIYIYTLLYIWPPPSQDLYIYIIIYLATPFPRSIYIYIPISTKNGLFQPPTRNEPPTIASSHFDGFWCSFFWTTCLGKLLEENTHPAEFFKEDYPCPDRGRKDILLCISYFDMYLYIYTVFKYIKIHVLVYIYIAISKKKFGQTWIYTKAFLFGHTLHFTTCRYPNPFIK